MMTENETRSDSADRAAPRDFRLSAVMIETRPLPELHEIIYTNHVNALPGDWRVTVFGSAENRSMFAAGSDNIDFKEIAQSSGAVFSAADYNALMTSPDFWDGLQEYDRVLMFQHDSRILRTGHPGWNRFLEFDYIGAPWSFQDHGGNGGLSLRNPKIMSAALQHDRFDYRLHGNEDVFICNILHRYAGECGYKLAPRPVCTEFACESIFALGTLGCHAIEKYLTPDECRAVLTQYD